ncbi:MAG TPA: hypothetical protein VGQ36_00385 [Thermoanaerobaculia bacterium]|jgi:hypothetical protein|nr:hypothetical protein [Thermoanaerobaculia bacterium]
MAETDPSDDAGPFRELHGEYVENAGQVLNLREYLDYFEPLGSALSRLPNGTGGPFLHHFTDSGGRTVGSLGWVVSAAAKRFGGWKLWGMWSNRTMPAVALPLFWPELSDPEQVSDWVGRANEDSARLLSSDRWPELLDEVTTTRLHESAFRDLLKAELERAYAVPPPHRHPIEVELTSWTLDLLPWLYLLGPVDPAAAQLQPNRFNGAGYQYILSDHVPPRADAEVRREIETMVDSAATDALAGWRMANELRVRRGRPKRVESHSPRREKRPVEVNDMGSQQKPKRVALWRSMWSEAVSLAGAVGKPLYRFAVLGLLAWIAINVHLIRKATVPQPPAASTTTTSPNDPSPAPVFEAELTPERTRRIGAALASRPPRNIRVSDAVLSDIARGDTDASAKLSRVAIEIFLRTNGCFARTETVDGKFSTAEARAIRNCATLQDERLMTSGIEPDPSRAIEWLERTVSD